MLVLSSSSSGYCTDLPCVQIPADNKVGAWGLIDQSVNFLPTTLPAWNSLCKEECILMPDSAIVPVVRSLTGLYLQHGR